MDAREFSVAQEARVDSSFSPFARVWRGVVVTPPESGVVVVQRVSVIDAEPIGAPVEAFTRDCSVPSGSSPWSCAAEQEEAERLRLARRQRIIDFLKSQTCPVGVSERSPGLVFRCDAFPALAALLGVE
jgi:hypothetical protein